MSEFSNYVYDRVIDYIEMNADRNPLRRAYARVMSRQNWNNREMGDLCEIIEVAAEEELDRNRRGDERDIIKSVIEELVTIHCGYFGVNDPEIRDAASDDVYDDMKRNAARWNGIVRSLSSGGRGHRDDRRGGFNGYGSGVRQGATRSNGFSSGTRDRDPFGSSRPNPLAGGGDGSSRRTASAWSTINEDDRRNESTRTPSWERGQQHANEAATRHARGGDATDGPDMTKPRPYDDFVSKGERWQLAHVSEWEWVATPNQPMRRFYNPDQEVCFLVKDANNNIREEFLPVSDDLLEYAHEIRTISRPNAVRQGTTGDPVVDALMPGSDPDALDIDGHRELTKRMYKNFLKLDTQSVAVRPDLVTVSSDEEAVVVSVGEGIKHNTDVTVTTCYRAVLLPADEKTHQALETLNAVVSEPGSNLIRLQRTMSSLRGQMAENVLNYIDRHFTQRVNYALKHSFGMGSCQIDSFVDDFEDLFNLKRFQKLGQAYCKQLLERTRNIMLTLNYVVDEAGRLEVIDAMDTLPIEGTLCSEFEEYRKNVVVLFCPMVYLHVKAGSEIFGGVGSSTRTPEGELLSTLVDLYKHGFAQVKSPSVRMVTADNVCYDLVAISGARDLVGVRLTD